jgi:hypothetical protein
MNTILRRHSLALLATIFGLVATCVSTVVAQGGYYLVGKDTLAPTTITSPTTSIFIPANREDVKAIGMGKTAVANGRTFIAMMYNPALLAEPKTALEIPSLQTSLPPQTFDATLYLKDHQNDFKQALSLKAVKAGAQALQAATTLPEQLAALQAIQNGLAVPRDLLNKVIGPADNPMVHGFRVAPSVSGQIGNFGFSLYGVGQSGFQVIQSATLDALLKVKLPSDLNDINQVNAALQAASELLSILDAVTDPITGEFKIEEAYPVTFAVSYIDIVGAAGYGYRVNKRLDVGATLKVINRRFSTKIIQTNDINEIWSQVRSDFNASATGFTFDVGGRYRFDFGLDVALSLQNIIPVKKIESSVKGTFVATGYDYALDQFGNKQVNGAGDTAVVFLAQRTTVNQPIDLKVPFIMNLGTRYAVTKACDVAFDLADVAAQDQRYENYGQRFRIGAEYRLEAMPDVVGITPRLGAADSHFTFGLGLNLFRVLQIDGAYAWDTFVQDWSYFAQLRLGW